MYTYGVYKPFHLVLFFNANGSYFTVALDSGFGVRVRVRIRIKKLGLGLGFKVRI